MKVTLRSLGGFTGGILPTVTVDLERLSRDEADTLRRLVAAARAENAPHRTTGMRNTLTIEDGAQSVVLGPSDAEAGKFPAFGALFDWISAHGTAERR
jgi:Emfourin